LVFRVEGDSIDIKIHVQDKLRVRCKLYIGRK